MKDCAECERLANEQSQVSADRRYALDALAMTPKGDPSYSARKKDVKETMARLRAASKRRIAHMDSHGR